MNQLTFWILFNLFVLVMLVLDLGVFHRRTHVVKFREAVLWSAMWIEPPAGAPTKPRRILSLITATGPTRAAAICRALVRATRCPRWPEACPQDPAAAVERSSKPARGPLVASTAS